MNKCQEISQDVQNSMDTNIPHVHNVLMYFILLYIKEIKSINIFIPFLENYAILNLKIRQNLQRWNQ